MVIYSRTHKESKANTLVYKLQCQLQMKDYIENYRKICLNSHQKEKTQKEK